MPHGAPPSSAPSSVETTFPAGDRVDRQTGILVDAAIAAGASTPVPGVREDYGITEAIVGSDVAGELLLDGVPLRVPASESKEFHFDDPLITGKTHTVTNNSAATMTVSLYVVGKQRRIPSDNPSGDYQAPDGEGSG